MRGARQQPHTSCLAHLALVRRGDTAALRLQGGNKSMGVDIENGGVRDLAPDGYLDIFSTKWWAFKLALEAVVTVLRCGPPLRSPGLLYAWTFARACLCAGSA